MSIHPLADVQSTQIGAGTRIWQFAVVLPGAVIGKNCNINCHTFIENDVVIGDNVTIKSGVYLWDGLVVEDDVFIGPNVTFINDPSPRSKQYPEAFTKTIIRKGASIGAGSVINCGVEIGAYSMVGAGSMLSKSTEAFTLWYGHPAKHKGYVTRKGITLTLQLTDKSGKQYELKGVEPIENGYDKIS